MNPMDSSAQTSHALDAAALDAVNAAEEVAS